MGPLSKTGESLLFVQFNSLIELRIDSTNFILIVLKKINVYRISVSIKNEMLSHSQYSKDQGN